MYSFGKSPPRALESFGVAGLLGEEAKVYYEQVFSTRHVGRVSDLISAKLADSGADVLRLRATLLFAIFEGYAAQGLTQGIREAAAATGSTTEPMLVECGIDDEKVAIGVSFMVADSQMDFTAIVERVRIGKASGRFEVLLAQLTRQAQRVVLRAQPSTRRVEVVGLLGLPGKFDPRLPANESPLELVLIEGAVAQTPKAKSYKELGDLNYPVLLAEDSPGEKAPAPSTGEFLARSSVIRQVDGTMLVKGAAPAAESQFRVKGGPAFAGDETNRISGVTAHSEFGVVRIEGSSPDEILDQTVTRIGGQAGAVAAAQVKYYRDQLEALKQQVERADQARAAKSAESKSKLRGIFSKLWVKEPASEDVANEVIIVKEPEAAAVVPPVLKHPVGQFGKVVVADEVKPPADVESTSDSLVSELHSGELDRTIARAQREAAEIKDELGSARAKRWMDGLVGDLLAEKGRLGELARKLNITVRSKEAEFRKRELAFEEELRKRDEVVKQKTLMFNRSKEQLAQANMALERLKAAATSGGEVGMSRAKLAQSQKLLGAVKQENTQLMMKVEELKSMLGSAQLVKRGAVSAAEMSALQTRSDRLAKKVEEFKKTNQQLMDKLNEQKKDRSAGHASVEDTKKRLEAAMKMITVTKKDTERLNIKIEELNRENSRLKSEGLALKTGRKPPSAA